MCIHLHIRKCVAVQFMQLKEDHKKNESSVANYSIRISRDQHETSDHFVSIQQDDRNHPDTFRTLLQTHPGKDVAVLEKKQSNKKCN